MARHPIPLPLPRSVAIDDFFLPTGLSELS